MQNNPLDKVVFIQKVAAFTKNTDSLKGLFQLAYVNNSWNDTIKNYAFHLFEDRARAIENTNILQKTCERVIKCGVIWFVGVFIFSNFILNRINLSLAVCKNKASLDMMQLIFTKIVEVGGKDLLKNQLTEVNVFGNNCLMYICINSSSPEVMKLILETIVEAGGYSLLKSQLLASDDKSWNCLMCCCRRSSSPEVMKLVFEKIIEAGGTALLKSQFTASTSDGVACLILACGESSSPEVVKLVFENIIEAGGTELLKSQLAATDELGRNCLMRLCSSWTPSAPVMKLFALVLFDLGLFRQQYEMLGGSAIFLKEETGINDASWIPNPESISEVKKLFKQ